MVMLVSLFTLVTLAMPSEGVETIWPFETWFKKPRGAVMIEVPGVLEVVATVLLYVSVWLENPGPLMLMVMLVSLLTLTTWALASEGVEMVWPGMRADK